MNKTLQIEVNKQQEIFLKEFAEKHFPGSDHNLATATPIHVVEVTDYIYVDEDIYLDEGELCFIYNEEVYTKAYEVVCAANKIKEDELPVLDTYINYHDVFSKYNITDVEVRTRIKFYRPVAFFFIRDEAKRYIKYQSHNLHKPRIYTYSPGYSNCGDFAPFWELLYSIGKQLNEESSNE